MGPAYSESGCLDTPNGRNCEGFEFDILTFDARTPRARIAILGVAAGPCILTVNGDGRGERSRYGYGYSRGVWEEETGYRTVREMYMWEVFGARGEGEIGRFGTGTGPSKTRQCAGCRRRKGKGQVQKGFSWLAASNGTGLRGVGSV